MKNYVGKTIAANCIVGLESLGGKISFEDTHMTFNSHKLNVQKSTIKIEYSQISKIEKSNTLGIIPNGLKITTKDNQEYKFVINSRSKIIEFLNTKI